MNIAQPAGQWHQMAAKLAFEGRLFIDGEFRDAVSGKKFETINPSDDNAHEFALLETGRPIQEMLTVDIPLALSYTQSKGVWVTIGH